jgi:hypothetical protein
MKMSFLERAASSEYLDSLPSNWSKRSSFKNVPFSSLIYVANPVAAFLSRRRVQSVFLVLSAWMLMVTLQNAPSFSSQRLKFVVSETRGGYCRRNLDIVYSNVTNICAGPRIQAIGLLLNGVAIMTQNVSNSTIADGLVLALPRPVLWNGWFFVTSFASHPTADPMRFALLSDDGLGRGWQQVGSSSYAFLHSSTVFFHGYHATSTARGSREVFDPQPLRAGGGLWISVCYYFALGALGALGLEEWGRHAPAAFGAAWALAHGSRAANHLAIGQLPGVAVCGALSLLHVANMSLVLHGCWMGVTFWYGLVSVALGVALRPYPCHGPSSASFFLSQGAVLLAIGAAMLAHKLATARRTSALVRRDRERYDAIWAAVARDAADELARLHRAAADAQRAAAAASAAARSRPHDHEWVIERSQSVPGPWGGPRQVGLKGGGGGGATRRLLEDLDELYQQVETEREKKEKK